MYTEEILNYVALIGTAFYFVTLYVIKKMNPLFCLAYTVLLLFLVRSMFMDR